jgi:hypothetical protein
MKKTGLFVICSLALASLLCSQSLVELAKKEKARRAKLSKQKTVVITNTNISQYRKNPAVTTTSGTAAQSQSQPRVETEAKAPARREGGEPAVKTATAVRKENPVEMQKNLDKAQEYVELLTLKMNALWQEFYSMDDMTSRDSIQQRLDSTYKQLQKAQADEEALRKKADAKK